MMVSFSTRELKRALMILSLTGFHFNSVLLTSLFRMSPTPLLCSSSAPEYKMLSSVAVFSSPSYFAQTKYVQIVVSEFPGDISSLSYLVKCSHVPAPKFQGNFGCQEGSHRRRIQVAGILADLPHICHTRETRVQA